MNRMNIKYPGYSFTNALFAVFTNLLLAFAWLITIITFGWVGRMWSCRILYWTLYHPWNVVYSHDIDNQDAEDEQCE